MKPLIPHIHHLLVRMAAITRATASRITPKISFSILAVCLLFSGVLAPAQQDVGFIVGNLIDQSGAAIAGAKVTLTWQSTNLQQTVFSDARGHYASQPLQVGQYTVSVSTQGFAPALVRDVIVDAGAHAEVNLSLRVGSEATTVTVEATPPAMDVTDGQLSTTIDTRLAQQLPVNGRSVMALAMLSPGVQSTQGAVSEGFNNRGTTVSAIRIGGGVNGLNNNILDGVSNLQDWLGEIAINLKSDAVQEYTVMSGIIPAQFGYTSGGVINAVSRSGTSKLHGSVYEFIRNDAFDAEASFPRPQFGKQELRFNNYGGTLGGPLMRDKLFLFANYEQYNYISRSPQYFSVPTLLERGGNFTDLGNVVNGVCTPINIYDDSNIVNGQRQQLSYNGQANVIDPSRIDPVALAYQNLYYPTPNNTTGAYNSCTHANNLLTAQPLITSERQGIVRADYKYTNADNIVARYAYYLNKSNNGGGFSDLYAGRNDALETQSAAFSETHVFTSNVLNDARFGLMIGDFPFQAPLTNANVAGQIGLPNEPATASPVLNNGVTTANYSTGFRSSATAEIIDDLSWTIGRHALHIGGSARWTEGYNSQATASPSGTFNFSSNTTAQGNDTATVSGTGSTYAAYLLGQVVSATQSIQEGSAFRRMLYAGYIQDDWQLTPRMTINAGLRYDMMTQAVEKHNGIENFDITQKNPLNPLFQGLVEYANTGPYGRNFVKENYGDLGPRLGFSYSLPDNKTAVRGGLAIYYPSVAVQSYDLSSGNTAGYTSMSTSYSASTSKGYLFQLKNGVPGPTLLPLGAAGGPNAFLGQSASYFNPVAKDPSAQVFTLTASRALPSNVVVDISYMGNHGNHFINYSPNLNALSPQYYSMGTAALSASVANPYAGLVPGTLGAATITEANLLKPYPYMAGVSESNPRIATYWSNLGLLSVQRRAVHGLSLIASYTFGKITDAGIQGESDLAGGTSTGASPQNPFNPQADHSLDSIDVTHRLTISGLYDLPFGVGRAFLSDRRTERLVGGWQVNAILTLQSGYPIGVTGANNQLASRPNLNPNVSLKVAHQSRSVLYRTGQLEWFNPLAFVNPPDYTFGNAPRKFGNLFGPGTENIDISVFKTTKITERVAFEFRVEAYNAFNHPNLPGPGTGFSAGPPASSANPYAEGGLNTSSSFGMITSGATSTRNVQLGGKVIF